MAYRSFKPYKSASQRRKARQDRAGLALIATVALALAGCLYGAAKVDEARGISVSQSLHNWGL